MASCAAQNIVVIQLQTGNGLTFGIQNADDLACRCTTWVHALSGFLEVDAFDTQILDLFHTVFVGTFIEVRKVGVGSDFVLVILYFPAKCIGQRLS